MVPAKCRHCWQLPGASAGQARPAYLLPLSSGHFLAPRGTPLFLQLPSLCLRCSLLSLWQSQALVPSSLLGLKAYCQSIQPGYSVLTKTMDSGPATTTHGFQCSSQLAMMLGDL